MVFTKLVIAGSRGYVADHAIRAIVACTEPVFDVTILTRIKVGGESVSIPGAKIIPVDYFDHNELVKAVNGADAILSFLSGFASKIIDKLLLKAAQQAGVRRIFPSEYSGDILHPEAVKLLTEGGNWPEDSSPVLTARKFLSLAEDGGPTSFTTLVPGAFMDPWLEGAFGIFDPRHRKVTFVEGGENYFSGCSLPFLADAIVAVLQMDESKTENKRIPTAEVRATVNDIADMYEEILGEKFERIQVASRDLIDQRNANLQAGKPAEALALMIHLAALNGSGAADLVDGLNFDGDGLLRTQRKTLRQLTIEALRIIGMTSKDS
ncbi:NAD(P)-binding protein [Trichoderma citrinoviride]|uniref:NAD(P)-binding protein n=1 Tax=Trichoderma citrinoviride TaxID=58853 RepID=A0A2T4BBD8_9HYPO|nr:NAD(P)-binding protein [Trichoderma citrinoviride]PTB66635.1 NAD(P)-binding protein [Trichoderma citrinoviride]